MPNVGRSAATTGAGSASENTFVFYDTSWVPFLCKIVNCGQLAFSEVPPLPLLRVSDEDLLVRREILALHGRPARRHPRGVVPWERLKVLTK
jgi:hypothetical protein